jgi:FKBP-type peptidyl-prolyl cis-trans isomerase
VVTVPADPRIPNAQPSEETLVILYLHEGEGEASEAGDTITVDYTGWNGAGELFDSSRLDWREPYELVLPGRVIQGWQEGLMGIKAGGARRLIIPPALAYGPQRRSAQIGPNETLYFDVECLSMTPAPAREGGGG